MSQVRRPEGTNVIWSIGKQVINAQNHLVKQMQGDWLWILGDDHDFGEDALMNLLAHDMDIVCPLNVMRAEHFGPLVFDEQGEQLEWNDLTAPGLMEVAACGNAGMLIKRHVLEEMKEPWFEWGPDGSPYQGSDLAFCWKARQAGFKVHVDLNTVFGHTTVSTFVPVRMGEGGQFGVMMVVQGQQRALFRMKKGQGIALFEQKGL